MNVIPFRVRQPVPQKRKEKKSEMLDVRLCPGLKFRARIPLSWKEALDGDAAELGVTVPDLIRIKFVASWLEQGGILKSEDRRMFEMCPSFRNRFVIAHMSKH